MTVQNPNPNPNPNPTPVVSNLVYDNLKRSAQLGLPAIGAFYFTIAQIWGLPKANEVVGTIAALNVLVGVMVTILSVKYKNSDARFDGVLDVSEDPETGIRSADLILKNYENPGDVIQQSEVTFKVSPPNAP